MKKAERRRRLLTLSVAGMLGLLAVAMAQANAEATALESSYRTSVHQLSDEMAQAGGLGYTSDDLSPVSARLAVVQTAPEPIWVGDRPGFYRSQGQQIVGLRLELRQLQASLLDESKARVGQLLGDAGTKVSQDRQLQVDDADLQPLQTRLNQLTQASTAASKLTDYRSLAGEASKLDDLLAQLGQSQINENAAIQQAADQLKAQSGGNPDAIRKGAQKALADARDDATIEGFLAMRSKFTNPDSVLRSLARMERFAAKLSDANLDNLAFAAAAVGRYADQVHGGTMSGMPSKTIVIYIQDQFLIAYDHGQRAMGTVVTTGRPSLPTDVGPMQIIYRQSPFIMKSPWPKESPFWYPDSPVRKVMWFTPTGEGLHDAPWRGWYGPGSNYGDGTHGCVNLPGDRVDWVWEWAPDGTPVIVIPGTGEPQTAQLAQDTIDTPAGQIIKGA